MINFSHKLRYNKILHVSSRRVKIFNDNTKYIRGYGTLISCWLQYKLV